MPNRSQEPSRLKILQAIFESFQQAAQWMPIDYEIGSASKSLAEATALIELLEEHDCGSIGGFDRGQGDDR